MNADGRRIQDLPVTERPWALAMAVVLGTTVDDWMARTEGRTL